MLGKLVNVSMKCKKKRRDPWSLLISILEKLQLANSIVAEFMEGRRRLIPPLH